MNAGKFVGMRNEAYKKEEQKGEMKEEDFIVCNFFRTENEGKKRRKKIIVKKKVEDEGRWNEKAKNSKSVKQKK